MKPPPTLFLTAILLTSFATNPKTVSNTAKQTDSSVTGVMQLSMIDTFGLEYGLVKEKTMNDFIQQQQLHFEIFTDTIINDERGIFMGKKLMYKNSFVQWLNDSTVTHLDINDSAISLQYGIHCGMSKEAFIQSLKLTPFHADTLTFETGFLENRIEFYFSNGKLKRIYLENLPD